MAVATPVAYAGASGQRVLGGRFAPGNASLAGAAALDGASAGGSLASAAAGAFAWTIADASTLNTGHNTTTQIATGVPAGAAFYVSPELLPGQRLVLDGATLNLVGDATVPTVDGAAPGSAIDAISTRDVVIEVMDAPLAICNHIRAGSIISTYGVGQTETRIWYGIQDLAQDGDTFEISPGAVAPTASVSPNSYLEPAMLKVNKSVIIRGMAGRGRWRLLPPGQTVSDTGKHGIMLLKPGDITGTSWDATPTPVGRRKSFVIQDFDFTDQYGLAASPVRLRSNSISEGDWNLFIASATFRNFKLGKTLAVHGGVGNSGFSGAAETLTIEDGHVFDCGNGSGQEHNFYVDARTLTIRGVRNSRTRGWSATPYVGFPSVEGHMFKLTAETGVIEGCVIDCTLLGDQSLMLQMKGGNNWTVRGNLWIDSQAGNNANGAILMDREYNADGTSPNFPPWCGALGNSILFEKNVWIGHYPRPIFFFRNPATSPLPALHPAGDISVTANRRLDSFICRDNIAMVATAAVYGSAFVLPGFPGASNAMWINLDPNAGANWEARGNSVMTYGVSEPGFSADNKLLKLYRREAGTIAASGSVATKRFVWPHGFIDRTDAFRGLA